MICFRSSAVWCCSRSLGLTPKRRTIALENQLSAIVTGAVATRNQFSGRETRRAVLSALAIASIFGTCSPTLMWRAVTRVKAIASESPAATPCERLPKIGSISSASAGSPRKPMPIEAIVIPIWQAESDSSILSSCSTTASAPASPSSASCSILPRRLRTSANSAATKKPLIAINSSRRTSRRTLIGYAARYFGLGRRRPFGERNIAGRPRSFFDRCDIEQIMRVATLSEMLEEVVRLGEATGMEAHAHELRGRTRGPAGDGARGRSRGAASPRVIALERLDPPRVGGFWIPEMISIAGGDDVAGDPGLNPPEVGWGELESLNADGRDRDARRLRRGRPGAGDGALGADRRARRRAGSSRSTPPPPSPTPARAWSTASSCSATCCTRT